MAAGALVDESELLFQLGDSLVEGPDLLCLRGYCVYEELHRVVRGLVDRIVGVGDLIWDLGGCLHSLRLVVGMLLACWLRIRNGLLLVHLVGRHGEELDDRLAGLSAGQLLLCYVCHCVSH